MEKKHVYVKKELLNYPCKICKRTVIVSQGTPAILETETTIMHVWNYKHQHIQRFELLDNNSPVFVEGAGDYD